LEPDAEKLASAYGIPVAKSGTATSVTQALSLSKKIGYPVVMKIVSPDVLHKTDMGGVRVNIKAPSEVREAYRAILGNTLRYKKDANVAGILVQKMATTGHEFVIGATRDPQFGPTVMFGLGGIYVELFRDVSFRFAPVSEKDSFEMIKELKAAPLLTGFRGSRPLDISATSSAIRSVGSMIVDNKDIDSIDINPIFVYSRGVMATDVRIILRKAQT
jgi:acetyl-CoA synthetase (ADP-forming)